MSSNRLKRPSSARRNIKQESFSPFVSASRLRNIQGLLKDGTKKSAGRPDAILCIAGIDSRYNDGMAELINYLLFGFFDVRKTELEKSGFEEEIIDDILFLIQHDKVDVYCNPINYHYLLPYVSHWRNVFFHCLTDRQYSDEEAAEEFKIKTFVSLVQDCEKIGIPYSNSVVANPHPFDKFVIEKWPIIQVYAVEGVGSGGFFTMKHDVEDISSEVHQVYNLMDPVALETVVIEQLSRFERQWNTMVAIVDMDLSAGDVTLTQDKVCEPLRSFYIHGRAIGSGDGPIKSDSQPYVLFGTNSQKVTMDRLAKGGNCDKNDLRSTCIGTNGTNFMVCKAVSPRGPINCTRTYFFTREFVNPLHDAKITAYEQNADLRLLTILYNAMIEGVLTGIQTYSSTLSLQKAAETANERFVQKCSGILDQVMTKFLKNKPQLLFTLQSVDNLGCYHELTEGERSLLMKTATMMLYDIPSTEDPGTSVGSLGFSETFLDSVLRVQKDDESIRLDGDYLLLTDHIPRYSTWALTSPDVDRKSLQSKLEGASLEETFGRLLLSGDPVNVGCDNRLCYPPEEAILYAFENGLVIISRHSGAIILHGNHIKTSQFYDGDTSNTIAVLVIEYQPTLVPYIPFHLQSDDCQLVLMFTPKSKAYKHLYTMVLHNWKQDSDVPKVQRVEELPRCSVQMNILLQHQHMAAQSKQRKTPLQTAAVFLPHLNTFLDHFSASSVGWSPVPEKDLAKIVRSVENTAEDEEKEVVVSILSGIPGSYQDKLCDVLAGLAKDQNRYVILKPALDQIQPFSALDIQTKLKATLTVHRRRKQSQLIYRNTRVLYIVPGYTDIVSVVQAIECHPDRDVRTHCCIGSVTACVNPLNFYMENKHTFPLLLNLCAQGWVNQIVMTSSTNVQNDELEEAQHLLRGVNSDVAFLLAEKGEVTRSPDIDAILSENAFGQAAKVRARHLLCPGWATGPLRLSRSPIACHQLKFTLPLDRQRFISKLRGLKASLVAHPFVGNIYNVQGRARFVGEHSEDAMEVHYTTKNGVLSIQPMSDTPKDRQGYTGNYIVFMGYSLDQTKLKDWLRDCAPQKPEKRSLVTRKDVTRDEVKKIHKEQHLESLPAGWFYNGTQFVSFEGTKQDLHPNLEDFVQDYMAKKNKIIRAFNASVDEVSDSYKDLFS